MNEEYLDPNKIETGEESKSETSIMRERDHLAKIKLPNVHMRSASVAPIERK